MGELKFKTTDLYLAAYLRVKGMALIGKNKLAGNKTEFVFQDEAQRERLVVEYFNDGLVRVAPFRHAIQDLKSIMLQDSIMLDGSGDSTQTV